ncbi:hypothetical protein ACFZAV_27645 [Streptomyces sp. NPDC008343]|uniref:hypothetical protein n=1 Tax=Streptomyces sp. NPDC008343 TaxID=3364828 RepID=UPI0036E63F05
MPRRNARRTARRTATAGFLAVLTAACGSTGTSAGGPTSTPASPSTPTPPAASEGPRATDGGGAVPSTASSGPPTDNTELAAEALLTKAYAELSGAGSARVAYASKTYTASVMVDTADNCQGTGDASGTRYDEVRQGDKGWVRIESPSDFFQLASDAPERLKSKYAYGDVFELSTYLHGCGEAAEVLEESHDAWSTQKAVKEKTAVVGGRKVIPVRTADGIREFIVYVAAHGRPLPLRIEEVDSSITPSWTLQDFGEPVDVRTPPAAKTVDITRLDLYR